MRLIFSEFAANYEKYRFPYQIWAIEEAVGERDKLLEQGFLPSRQKIGLWYLARSARINLNDFKESSENRRIVKNTEGYRFSVTLSAQFKLSVKHLEIVKAFEADTHGFIISESALKRITSKYCTGKVFEWFNSEGEMIGFVPLMQTETAAFYWYAFYDPAKIQSGLGARMMLEAITTSKSNNNQFIYIGTVYSNSSLYKANFSGFEFFDGFGWRQDKDELKFLIGKDQYIDGEELFKSPDFQSRFYKASTLSEFIKKVGKDE